jgi:hypothetical protein
MTMEVIFVIASFTAPENFGPTPLSMLWLLPLVAAIAIIYKATNLPSIKASNFIKETSILFGTMVVCMIIIALALHAFAWLIAG